MMLTLCSPLQLAPPRQWFSQWSPMVFDSSNNILPFLCVQSISFWAAQLDRHSSPVYNTPLPHPCYHSGTPILKGGNSMPDTGGVGQGLPTRCGLDSKGGMRKVSEWAMGAGGRSTVCVCAL
jgi:hypothetical protein